MSPSEKLGAKEQEDVFFCLVPLKYTGLQGPEKWDEAQPFLPAGRHHMPIVCGVDSSRFSGQWSNHNRV
jgi:hypothetical protein